MPRLHWPASAPPASAHSFHHWPSSAAPLPAAQLAGGGSDLKQSPNHQTTRLPHSPHKMALHEGCMHHEAAAGTLAACRQLRQMSHEMSCSQQIPTPLVRSVQLALQWWLWLRSGTALTRTCPPRTLLSAGERVAPPPPLRRRRPAGPSSPVWMWGRATAAPPWRQREHNHQRQG